MATQRRVTTSRIGRLGQLGRLVGGIAGGMLGEGARQLSRGERPRVADALLTPTNAGRLAQRLSEMRGAAMKVGQLLSMDSGEVLPPQLTQLLARLREDAHQMPLGQVASVLERAWGSGWQAHFERFLFTPLAAASIGQVHEARLKDGRQLAVKIQYPGIRDSIDSDVDNVATLLGLFRLLPEGMPFRPLLDEAKLQLHQEADYRSEARSLKQFAARLADDPRFELPDVLEALSDENVLTMTYLGGQTIDSLDAEPSRIREAVAYALTELALREVFDWGLVQTDPNFANYLYDADTGRIQLLDFGATRFYPDDRRHAVRELLAASIGGDDADIARAAQAAGYVADDDPAQYREFVVRLLHTATEPARNPAAYPFGTSDLAQRMRDILIDMRVHSRFTRLPPTDILFLHRKLGGLYLLLSRLRVRLPIGSLVRQTLDRPDGDHRFAERRLAV